MNASELFQAGRLQEAISAQIQEVKTHPADHARRLFLFELFCFSGDLDRARRQIDAVRYDDAELHGAIALYQRLIDSEQARRRLFAEGLVPEFIGEPSEHLRLRLQAVNRLREGQPSEAAEYVARAAEAMPAVSGQLNGRPFTTLRDADDLLAGVIEVMAHGQYYWVGLEQLGLLAMGSPQAPRDLLFIPARVELEGVSGDVFLPALYPGSHEHTDDRVKLGRMTDWKTFDPDGPVLGAGLRTFLCDDDEISLLEWREIQTNRA